MADVYEQTELEIPHLHKALNVGCKFIRNFKMNFMLDLEYIKLINNKLDLDSIDEPLFSNFNELLTSHLEDLNDKKIYIKLLFQNWYCLTLTTQLDTKIEEKLRNSLPIISQYGLTNFFNEADFLVVWIHMSYGFYWMFDVTENYVDEVCKYFIDNFKDNPLAQLYKLDGKLDNSLKKKIERKKAEIKNFVLSKYSSDELLDSYMRETFL